RGDHQLTDSAVIGCATRPWSVDVADVALVGSQLLDVGAGRFGIHPAMLGDDLMERLVDVARHTGGVAADVEPGPVLEPGPQTGSVFAHPVLDVDLAALVAGEGCVEAVEVPGCHVGLELLAVVEV